METVNDLISDLGGSRKIARLPFVQTSSQAVIAWRKNGVPHRLRLPLVELYQAKGITLNRAVFEPLK